MYKMAEVDDMPEFHKGRRNAPHVNQLREFIRSGKKNAQLLGVPADDALKVYNGLTQAAYRQEFRGIVAVKKYGNNVYLIRRG